MTPNLPLINHVSLGKEFLPSGAQFPQLKNDSEVGLIDIWGPLTSFDHALLFAKILWLIELDEPFVAHCICHWESWNCLSKESRMWPIHRVDLQATSVTSSPWRQEEQKPCIAFYRICSSIRVFFFNVEHQINFRILFGWYKHKWVKKKKQMGYISLAIYMWLKMEEKNVCGKCVLDFLNPELLQSSFRLAEHQYTAALASLQWPIKPQLSWKPACILRRVLHWAAKMA